MLLPSAALAQASASTSEATTALNAIPATSLPLQVHLGFNLVNITDMDEKNETVSLDGMLVMRWRDPRLAYDPATVGMAGWEPGNYSMRPRRLYVGRFAVLEIYEGWRPHVVFPNGVGDRMDSQMAVFVWPDGMVGYRESFAVTAETPMTLGRFPFDRHQLELFVHAFAHNRDELVFVPDQSLVRQWNRNMGIAGWRRDEVSLREQPAPGNGGEAGMGVVSEVAVRIDVSRRPQNVLISIVLPLVLLVCLTWVVFWLDEESASNRVNISFIGILSVVAYYLVIFERIPDISYVTLMDAFMILSFFILAASVAISIVVDKLNRARRKEVGDRVDRVCRWAFPAGYALLTGLLCLWFLRGAG